MPAKNRRASAAVTTTPGTPPMPEETAAATPPQAAAKGIVHSQASAICPTTPQRTRAPLPSPTPRIAPEQACVVEMAKPKKAEPRMTEEATHSAAKPCGELISVTRFPRV